MKSSIASTLASSVILSFTTLLHAQIVVPNGDFEAPAGYTNSGAGGTGIYGSEDGGNSVPDWNFVVNEDASYYGDFPQSATNHFGFNNLNDSGETGVWTTTGTLTLAGLPAVFTPGTTYTLTLLSGGPTGGGNYAYPASVSANLIGYTTTSTAAGNPVLASSTAAYSASYIASNESNGFTPLSFSFTTPLVTSLTGDDIAVQVVEIGGGESTQTYLDNVALSVTPEPGTWAMLLGGVVVLATLVRRGRTARA
jgi:hypothetical protein